jgi:hypothetical protein
MDASYVDAGLLQQVCKQGANDMACDYDSAVAALKAEYGKHKTYSLRRGQQREAVRQLAETHGLTENRSKGGYVQCTASICYGWSVYEADDKAVLMYRDGGMGWDTVTLLGKDKHVLEALRQTGIKLGLVRLRK